MRLLMCKSFCLVCEYSNCGLLLDGASSRLSVPLLTDPRPLTHPLFCSAYLLALVLTLRIFWGHSNSCRMSESRTKGLAKAFLSLCF